MVALEPGIARLLATLYPPKESAKGKVNPYANFLQHLRVGIVQEGVFLLPSGKHFHGIIPANAFLALIPRLFARFEHFVVDPPTCVKGPLHSSPLGRSGKQAILECFTHETIIQHCYTEVNKYNAIHLPVSTGSFLAKNL